MSQYDLLVRNGTVMTPAGESRADLAVADGRIVAIAPDLGRIVRTLVRGNTVFLEGKIVSAPIGRFLKPSFPQDERD